MANKRQNFPSPVWVKVSTKSFCTCERWCQTAENSVQLDAPATKIKPDFPGTARLSWDREGACLHLPHWCRWSSSLMSPQSLSSSQIQLLEMHLPLSHWNWLAEQVFTVRTERRDAQWRDWLVCLESLCEGHSNLVYGMEELAHINVRNTQSVTAARPLNWFYVCFYNVVERPRSGW